MKTNQDKFCLFLLVLLAGIAGGCGNAGEGEQPKALKLFPPREVCSYPANSSIKKFHFLGGDWQAASIVNGALEFSCGTSPNVVNLYGNRDDFINVEYTVIGIESGASMISVDYSASGSSQVENELTLRNVYTRFVEEIIKQALEQPPPELLRKKILNLNSFSELGSESYESFNVGPGFINISRVRSKDNSMIRVKTQIFADTSFKLR